MITKSNGFLASAIAALLICLTSCGKKEEPAPAESPQSKEGGMLEAARKTMENANARTERVKEATE